MPAMGPDPPQPSVLRAIKRGHPIPPLEHRWKLGEEDPGVCPGQLTSDRKVWADFWAPTCSRYSYTYSANLRAGWGRLRLSGQADGQVEMRGRRPTVSPHRIHLQPHSLPPFGPLILPISPTSHRRWHPHKLFSLTDSCTAIDTQPAGPSSRRQWQQSPTSHMQAKFWSVQHSFMDQFLALSC